MSEDDKIKAEDEFARKVLAAGELLVELVDRHDGNLREALEEACLELAVRREVKK